MWPVSKLLLLLLMLHVLLLLVVLLIRMVKHKAIAIRNGMLLLLLLSPRRRARRVMLRDRRVEFGGARRGTSLADRLEQLMAGTHGRILPLAVMHVELRLLLR